MDVFVARQPIFDKNMKVYGYELLYRDGFEKSTRIGDGDKATSMVVVNSFLSIGFDTLTGNKRAFINFTKKLIYDEMFTLFPKELIVIEILEDIEIDDEFIDKCKKIKEEGFTLALDDFDIKKLDKYLEIIQYLDIIKVDFMLNSIEERQQIIKRLNNGKIKFLAEKVETREEFEQALEMGYNLFQGYFLSKPVTLSGKGVFSDKINCLKILKQLNVDEPNFDDISNIVERDVSLSYNLLKLINSGTFFTGNKIKSIKHALIMLGFKELRKWISLILLRDMNKDNPDEIMKNSLIRGKFAELLSMELNIKDRKSEAFLMGMFSLIDTIVALPLEDIVKDLPLNDDVKDSLLGEKNIFRDIYEIILSYEKADWNNILILCDQSIDSNIIPKLYIQALEWTNDILNSQ